MKAIVDLKQEINGENRKEIINSFGETIAEDITKATKEKEFFSLPLNNILNIVSKTNLSEQEDPISLIKTIITKTMKNHSEETETVLLLSSRQRNLSRGAGSSDPGRALRSLPPSSLLCSDSSLFLPHRRLRTAAEPGRGRCRERSAEGAAHLVCASLFGNRHLLVSV